MLKARKFDKIQHPENVGIAQSSQSIWETQNRKFFQSFDNESGFVFGKTQHLNT